MGRGFSEIRIPSKGKGGHLNPNTDQCFSEERGEGHHSLCSVVSAVLFCLSKPCFI